MKPKAITALAIGAYLARKSLHLATYIFIGVMLALVIIIGLLAYNYTAWWWILALPLLVVCLVFFVLYWVVQRLISTIYRHPFSRDQRQALDEFTDKVRRLVETRSIPLPIFAIITIKDVLIHKDAKSIRKLIEDSSSLKDDLKKLESYFGHR